ncbi:MAG: hypothetical protein ABSD75_06000 [Terriglobales bacterium]|jgi:hypothetical protein
MSIPVLGKTIDERFLDHRLRATSLGGIVGGMVAIGLFIYRYNFDHLWSWDLFAVIATILGVKMSIMIWYWLTD